MQLLACLICLISFPAPPEPQDRVTDLAEAIKKFNEEALDDAIGKNQAPITMDEVIAAIQIWKRDPKGPVSEKLAATFREIAETRKLPPNACFESLNGLDPGKNQIYDVWFVRIRIKREDKSSFAFPIRRKMVSSRSLEQELARLKVAAGQEPGRSRKPSWHRMETRIRDLEERIRKANAKVEKK